MQHLLLAVRQCKSQKIVNIAKNSIASGSRLRSQYGPLHQRVYSTPPVQTMPSKASHLSVPLSAGIGGFAGIVSALTGVGGGLILIPALARATTLAQQTINGTSIGAVTVAASVGALNYITMNSCNIPLAIAVTMSSVPFARYGVALAHKLSSAHLSVVVGTMMLLCTPLIVFKNSPYIPKWGANPHILDLQLASKESNYWDFLQKENNTDMQIEWIKINSKYVVAGALAGFISGLCGLGGGILMTAYLTAASDLPQQEIIGTSLLSIVPTAAASTYFNVKKQSIHIPTAIRIGGSLSLGVFLTSKYITLDVPQDILRGILATTLGSAAIVMIRKGVAKKVV